MSKQAWATTTIANKTVAIASSVAAFAAVVYSVVACFQLVAIRDSNESSREALTKVQSAFLYLEGYRLVPDPAQPDIVTFALQLRNSGTTQAKNARYHANRGPYPLPENFTFPDYDSNGKVIVDSEQYQGFIAPQSMNDIASVVSISRGAGGERSVVSYGWVKYNDVFDGTPEHITLWCNQLTVFFPPNGFPINYSKIPCKTHNCADEQCKNEKR